MLLVASVLMVRQSSFNGAILLRNQAYDIAFTIRELQLNAVSAADNGSLSFRTRVGANFNITTPNNYTVFLDVDRNNQFGGPDAAFGRQGVIDSRFEIRSITIGGSPVIGGMAIVFERPNFDAMIGPAGNANAVRITIGKKGTAGQAGDVTRTVEVTATGQISVLDI